MDKTITIYKGDEYRAKIATEIDKSDLFAETYIRAFSIIDEIIAELTDAREMQDSGKENFNGMGNNIIVFSGQRGQGKTSIMQSFAKWLKQDVTADNIIRNSKENIEWKNLVARVKQSGFVVLESIDPSSLEKAESILQVLITRLFYLFDKYRKTHSNNDVTSEREWMQSIQNITTLFQKCLTNIDYLKMGRPKEWEMENLEDLVQISNSSVFKENLKELIDKLLKTLDEKEKQKKFLIIPIDDTDLATQEVFDICEDIRNYLSIPNIIILMAVDYKQLIYSVTQKYLTNYDKMLISSYDMGFEASKCYEIATQYLEKVLPAGHRIDLPQIEAIINEKPQSISFKYMDKENNDLLGLTLDKDSNSDDRGIHVQLLKVLYNRTGIIFCDKEVKQAFFPRKMRELTHFVKLLGDMNDIVCDEVYQKRDRTSMLRVEQNITVLRQYFLDYWCAKNLTLIQKEFIEKLDIVMRSHDKNKIFAEIQKFYSEINIGTFDEFFKRWWKAKII